MQMLTVHYKYSQEQKDKVKDKTPEASKWTGGGLVLIALGLATIETWHSGSATIY